MVRSGQVESGQFANSTLSLLFFLESNSILSPHQAGFRPGRSTLDQILYLSQSISDRFNKSRPGSRTILSTIDFSKAFDSVWHPALFTNLFRLASLHALLVGLNLFFLIGVLVWSFKITKAAPFESVEVFRKDPFSALYFSLFSLMIYRPLCLLPSAALFTLMIWPFGPPPPRSPTAVEATQGALFPSFSLIPCKCEATFFSVDPHQANL